MDSSIYNGDLLDTDTLNVTLWVRHAEKDRRYRGIEPFGHDVPLSNAGKRSVMEMSIPYESRWVGVVSSPYLRCYSTALLLSRRLKVPCIVDLAFGSAKPGRVRHLLALTDDAPDDATASHPDEMDATIDWASTLQRIGTLYQNHIIVTHNARLVSLLRHLDPQLHDAKWAFDVCGCKTPSKPFSAIVVTATTDISTHV
jgi:broad specificity phosphatase PhoE